MKSRFSGNFLKIVELLKREGFRGIMARLHNRKRNDYRRWLDIYQKREQGWRDKLSASEIQLKEKPLISIILPVYNPEPGWLNETITSVRDQIYSNWELCIADDASTNPEIHRMLEKAAKADQRIRVVFRKTNGHISVCSNSAIEIATGSWIALLDHDDLLSPDALYEVASVINQNPDIRLIYSDEDKITGNGKRRCTPYFKPDWNRYLFYSQNLFSHFGVYHTELVKRAGLFRKGFEGSQDYDLVLRCIEHIRNDQVYHIPKVLYHWRIHPGSTSFSAKSKPFASDAATMALQEHFVRTHIPAHMESIGFGYKTEFKLPAQLPDVTVVIPITKKPGNLPELLKTHFCETAYPVAEVILVYDKDQGLISENILSPVGFKLNIKLLGVSQSTGLSYLINKGVRASSGKFVCLFQPYLAPLDKYWLHSLMQLAIQQSIGAVAPKIVYPDMTIQHAGIIMGMGDHGVAGFAHHGLNHGNRGYFGRAGLVSEFSAVTGTCMVFSRACFDEIHGMDEENLHNGYFDVDFGLRLSETGYQNLFTPFSTLIYHGNTGQGFNAIFNNTDASAAEIAFMKARWPKMIQHDPAYNPNLALEHPHFSLKWPLTDI